MEERREKKQTVSMVLSPNKESGFHVLFGGLITERTSDFFLYVAFKGPFFHKTIFLKYSFFPIYYAKPQ